MWWIAWYLWDFEDIFHDSVVFFAVLLWFRETYSCWLGLHEFRRPFGGGGGGGAGWDINVVVVDSIVSRSMEITEGSTHTEDVAVVVVVLLLRFLRCGDSMETFVLQTS